MTQKKKLPSVQQNDAVSLNGKRPQHSAEFPRLVEAAEAAAMLGRPPSTLKGWRYRGVGPDWIEMEGRIMYDRAVLLKWVKQITRVGSVRAARE